MAVVQLELDRERALREVVRVENFLKRTPPDVVEALRELEAADGLAALLKNAPLVAHEETPPPSPPVESADEVYDQIADYPEKWGRNKEVTFQGRPAIEQAVQKTDGSPGVGTSEGTTRAQLGTANKYEPGKKYWFGGSFFLPQGFPTSPPGWGVNLLENYYAGEGGTSPPWELQAREGVLQTQLLGSATNKHSFGPISNFTGRWVDWQVALVPGAPAAAGKPAIQGKAEFWLDGKQVMQETDVPIGKFSGKMRFIVQTYYSFQFGLSSVTVYHGILKVGKTRASVL